MNLSEEELKSLKRLIYFLQQTFSGSSFNGWKIDEDVIPLAKAIEKHEKARHRARKSL